jgi:hypothetical protein
MEIISWGSGRVGDKDKDGNFEIEMKNVKVFGSFTVPDIKVEIPTAAMVTALLTVGSRVPWAKAIGNLMK